MAAALSLVPSVARAQLVRIGSDIGSSRALRQPATVVALKSGSGPWLTRFDVGVVIAPRPAGFRPEFGVRLSAGSSRPRAERVFGAVARGDWSLGNLGVVGEAQYEADGGFGVQKGLLGGAVTWLGWGAAGLGRFTGHRTVVDTILVPDSACDCRGAHPRREEVRLRSVGDVGVRWRPWIGASYGHAFARDSAAARETGASFFRGYGRLEGQARVRAGGVFVEAGLAATSWYVDGFHGNDYAKGSLSIELGESGFSLTGTAELGRQPPRFIKVEEYSVGLGFRFPSPR